MLLPHVSPAPIHCHKPTRPLLHQEAVEDELSFAASVDKAYAAHALPMERSSQEQSTWPKSVKD